MGKNKNKNKKTGQQEEGPEVQQEETLPETKSDANA